MNCSISKSPSSRWRPPMFDFNDPNWRPYNRSTNTKLGVAPNQLWHNAITREGACVVNQSTGWDDSWALSVAGFEYIREAQQKVTAAYVVLARRNQQEEREIVIQKPVAAVVAALQGVPPREGSLGPYWWMRADLTPHPRRPGNRELPQDDTPF